MHATRTTSSCVRDPQLGVNPELRIFVKEDLCGDSEQLHNLLEDTYDTKTGDDVYKNQKCRMRLQWGKRGRARSLNETHKSRLLSETLVGKIGPVLFPSHNEVQLSWQRSHASCPSHLK